MHAFVINKTLDFAWDESAVTFSKYKESAVVLVVIRFEFDSVIHSASYRFNSYFIFLHTSFPAYNTTANTIHMHPIRRRI